MQAMPVQVQIAKSQKIPDTTEYLSILKSRHSATINPQVEGQITKIFVKSGDRVNAGTPLLQIDPLKQQATVSSQEASRVAQEANLRYAQSTTGPREEVVRSGRGGEAGTGQCADQLRRCGGATEVARTASERSSRWNCTTTRWRRRWTGLWATFRCAWEIAWR